MPELLWLEWERDVIGYDLVRLQLTPFHKGLMRASFITNGDKLSENAKAILLRILGSKLTSYKHGTLFLVPHCQTTTRYRPLEIFPSLFREFAEIDYSPEGVKRFVDRFGPIHNRDGVEEVMNCYASAATMHKAVEWWEEARESGNWTRIASYFNEERRGRISVSLDPVVSTGPPALHIEPDSLLAGMWLQFAQAVTENSYLRRCAWCPTWFAYGSGTGRRKTAQYCSDRCRKAAHRHKKEAQQ